MLRLRIGKFAAAGACKAEAILAATRHHRHDYLVTDEGAAARIITLLRDEG